MTSALYDRTVKITRPPAQLGVGFQPTYASAAEADETLVAEKLPASIQLQREGTRDGSLPAGGTVPFWDVFMPKGAVAYGQVRNKDLVTDDLSNRFQVVGAYVNRLGARLRVQTLEA